MFIYNYLFKHPDNLEPYSKLNIKSSSSKEEIELISNINKLSDKIKKLDVKIIKKCDNAEDTAKTEAKFDAEILNSDDLSMDFLEKSQEIICDLNKKENKLLERQEQYKKEYDNYYLKFLNLHDDWVILGSPPEENSIPQDNAEKESNSEEKI